MAVVGADLTLGVSSVFAWPCAFEYAVDNGSWKHSAVDLDATLLASDVAGEFVGALAGLSCERTRTGINELF